MPPRKYPAARHDGELRRCFLHDAVRSRACACSGQNIVEAVFGLDDGSVARGANLSDPQGVCQTSTNRLLVWPCSVANLKRAPQ